MRDDSAPQTTSAASGPDAAEPNGAAAAGGSQGGAAITDLDSARRAVLGVATGGERESLETFLDYLRWVVVHRANGLTEEQAHRRLVPSDTTLASLLHHLAIVECNWFQRIVAGRDPAELGLDPANPGYSWGVPGDATLASLTAAYERECARSRATAARFSLDDSFAHDELRNTRLSLRWIMLHMIEETARHAGHGDILREQTDGTTGDAD
ncbi:DinB family protein [Streptomonospora sediminis]